MLLSVLQGGASFQEILTQLILVIPIILISLTFHEVAHGYVSYKLGDPTAYNMGRLSLNPVKHLDPIGSICMLLFGVGWARPVPVNARYYKNPKKGMALTALAGPVANLILAFIGVIISAVVVAISNHSGIYNHWIYVIWLFFSFFSTMNVYLAVFNLLPIPPFDGSRILFVFLPVKYYFKVMQYERIIQFVILALLWTGILTLPIGYITDWILDGMYYSVGLVIR